MYIKREKYTRLQKGYTLVELAFTLVIISTFMAIVYNGYILIQTAALRKVINDAKTYINAINIFEQTYGYLPGDFPNASLVWGTACDATPSNCNGNGNGYIEYDYSSQNKNEALRAWQQLSLAGMIKGSYSGVTDLAGTTQPGYNAPTVSYTSNIASSSGNGVYIEYGGKYSPPNNSGQALGMGSMRWGFPSNNSFIAAQDAYYIDLKMDDGYPRNGLVWGGSIYGYSGGCFFPTTVDAPYGTGSCMMAFTIRMD